MEIQQNLSDTLPYKQDVYPKTGIEPTASGVAHDGHNPSRFETLERTANPGLTQRSEYLVYTEGVGGSNPSARTILPFPPQITTREAITVLQELVDAGYGRAHSYFNAEREQKARLAALTLIERYLVSGGAM